MDTIEKAVGRMGDKKPLGNTESPARAAAGTVPPAAQGAPSRSDSRVLDIDLNRLLEKGMIIPSMGRSQIAEEYRHIKRPLLKNVLHPPAGMADNSNTIMVTSALPGEGKTFTAINLAMSIAMELDHTCLLVDADVERPSIFSTLGIDYAGKGLIDYLVAEDFDLSEVMFRTNVPKLTVMPAGHRHAHATELLASEGMRALLSELAQRYHDRVIIFDAPPLLATSEARVLAGLMGQIVIVVEAVRTKQSVIKQALELVDKQRITGMVLNKARTRQSHDYYDYYSKTEK